MNHFHLKRQKWINKRHLLSFFISLFLFSTSVSLKAQNQTLSLSLEKVSLRQFFDAVEKQSQYKFAYRDLVLDSKKDVSISVSGKSINDVLSQVLLPRSLQYGIQGNVINITQSNAVPQSGKKTIKVSGKVLDELGEPVIGGSVTQKGASAGTVTDLDGNFSLEVPVGSTIAISYLGYSPMEMAISNEKPVTISLKEDVQKLNEVVVIGYGTRQRKSVTGAIDQVGAEVFENRPVGNAMQALQGAAANLTIQQKSMNPNDNSMSINVRGISTMGNNDPLIVIDGLISQIETLNNINPSDIENVSVLKDAGSAAIYGSRSANGVILVTTKKGMKSNKPVVRFSGLTGYEDPQILYSPVKGYENALLRNQANMNVGSAPNFTPAQIRDLQDHQNEEEWWYDQILKKGLQQTYNMSVTGGNENTTYMVSAGYYNQESNFKGSFGLERYNMRSNLTTQYGRFKLTSVMAYNRIMQRTVAGGTGSTIINASRIPPYYYYKMKQTGQNNQPDKYFVNDVISDMNSLAHLEQGGSENKDEDNIIGSMNLDFNIMEGLKAKGLVGLDLTQHHRYRRDIEVPLYTTSDLEKPAVYMNSGRTTEDYNQKRYTLNAQFMLDYDRTFNSVHQITGLLGVSNESFTRQSSRIAWKFTDPDLGLPTTDDVEIDPGSNNSNGDTDQTSITSLFGRLGYDYQDRYYAEATFRYDGSSKFDKNHRWGFFPSVSAGWRMSEENFMESYKEKVGDLKFRGSYGILGNQNVDNYSYRTTYQMYPNQAIFNDEPVPGTGYNYGNPLLTWEKSANFNVGVDASFLENKLFVSLDYFNKETSDILLEPVIPSVFGTKPPKQNNGIMKNQGWEATISYRAKTDDFQHNFSLNVSDSKNEVIDFGGKEDISQNDQLYKLIREGEALGSYYGYKTAGMFQSYGEITNSALPIGADVQPGDVKYVDADGNGVIDEKDRVVLGNAFPRYTFGFTYDLAWKGFDFNMLIQGVGKRDMYVRGELIEPFHSNYSYVIYQHQLDYWTPTNPDAKWPRLVAPSSAASNNNWGKPGTDIYLLDGAYVRLKNIQVGYTLPKNLSTKFGVQKLRVSLNAQNLLTLSKNSFIDPESSEFGNNMGGIGGVSANSARNYPSLVYYGVGLEIEF